MHVVPGEEKQIIFVDNFQRAQFYRKCWLFVSTTPSHVIKIDVTFFAPDVNITLSESVRTEQFFVDNSSMHAAQNAPFVKIQQTTGSSCRKFRLGSSVHHFRNSICRSKRPLSIKHLKAVYSLPSLMWCYMK